MGTLIILDSFTFEELVNNLQQLPSLKGTPICNAIMIFKVYCSLDWIRFKALSIFEHRRVIDIGRKYIYEALENLQKEVNSPEQ